eukprot:1153898-Pelagomonas_calceolata.AAC.2
MAVTGVRSRAQALHAFQITKQLDWPRTGELFDTTTPLASWSAGSRPKGKETVEAQQIVRAPPSAAAAAALPALPPTCRVLLQAPHLPPAKACYWLQPLFPLPACAPAQAIPHLQPTSESCITSAADTPASGLLSQSMPTHAQTLAHTCPSTS